MFTRFAEISFSHLWAELLKIGSHLKTSLFLSFQKSTKSFKLSMFKSLNLEVLRLFQTS